jgi:hypothetical protein
MKGHSPHHDQIPSPYHIGRPRTRPPRRPAMPTSELSMSMREQLTLELVDNLTLALGRRPLVEQAGTPIVDAYYSEMAATDRALKILYILDLCGLSTEVLPDEMRRFVRYVRPRMASDPSRLVVLPPGPAGRRVA